MDYRSFTIWLLLTFPKSFTFILKKYVIQSFSHWLSAHHKIYSVSTCRWFPQNRIPPNTTPLLLELSVFPQVISAKSLPWFPKNTIYIFITILHYKTILHLSIDVSEYTFITNYLTKTTVSLPFVCLGLYPKTDT